MCLLLNIFLNFASYFISLLQFEINTLSLVTMLTFPRPSLLISIALLLPLVLLQGHYFSRGRDGWSEF
jgi:hypothetical protein